jgi:hypothetical protein
MYDIVYKPRTTLKAQALSDYMARVHRDPGTSKRKRAGLLDHQFRQILTTSRCRSKNSGNISEGREFMSWPVFMSKSSTHSMCLQGSNLHTYRTENRYRITNITIYNIYYWIMSYKRLSQTLSEASEWKDTINPQTIDRW